ncbi:uncharacterized protein LOC103486128 isoform X3 [Cucumis melo]|uniref:Uncharacterized protein LOC103486128 isoform X3 n=1 Tax=Cucumis melo TaxID=3656 RepID=A0ABM3L2E5_CUCME|nr:uncharacterized protein LOC103486128 isoform X3 [Cucumis melo]
MVPIHVHEEIWKTRRLQRYLWHGLIHCFGATGIPCWTSQEVQASCWDPTQSHKRRCHEVVPGTIAGAYVGMEYEVERIRITRDWYWKQQENLLLGSFNNKQMFAKESGKPPLSFLSNLFSLQTIDPSINSSIYQRSWEPTHPISFIPTA